MDRLYPNKWPPLMPPIWHNSWWLQPIPTSHLRAFCILLPLWNTDEAVYEIPMFSLDAGCLGSIPSHTNPSSGQPVAASGPAKRRIDAFPGRSGKPCQFCTERPVARNRLRCDDDLHDFPMLNELSTMAQTKQTLLIPVNNFGIYIPYYPLYHVSLHMSTHKSCFCLAHRMLNRLNTLSQLTKALWGVCFLHFRQYLSREAMWSLPPVKRTTIYSSGKLT